MSPLLGRFEGHRFGAHWTVGIRTGSYGSMLVHSACSTQQPGEYSVLIEPKRPFCSSILRAESEIYGHIDELGVDSKLGFLIFERLYEENRFFALVLQPVGKSLEYYFQQLHSFSSKTISMIAIQTINRLITLHKSGFLHCAVSPQNLSDGATERHSSTIFLHNFQYCSTMNDEDHRTKPSKNPDMLFSSPTTQAGHRHCARDDLISLGYMLLYFMNIPLPWKKLTSTFIKRNRKEAVRVCKLQHTVLQLSLGCSDTIQNFMRDVFFLEDNAIPNYAKLRSYFYHGLEEEGEEFDCKFDWMDHQLNLE